LYNKKLTFSPDFSFCKPSIAVSSCCSRLMHSVHCRTLLSKNCSKTVHISLGMFPSTNMVFDAWRASKYKHRQVHLEYVLWLWHANFSIRELSWYSTYILFQWLYECQALECHPLMRLGWIKVVTSRPLLMFMKSGNDAWNVEMEELQLLSDGMFSTAWSGFKAACTVVLLVCSNVLMALIDIGFLAVITTWRTFLMCSFSFKSAPLYAVVTMWLYSCLVFCLPIQRASRDISCSIQTVCNTCSSFTYSHTVAA